MLLRMMMKMPLLPSEVERHNYENMSLFEKGRITRLANAEPMFRTKSIALGSRIFLSLNTLANLTLIRLLQ